MCNHCRNSTQPASYPEVSLSMKICAQPNSEVQKQRTKKHTKWIEIHQSQITNHDLLFPKRSAKKRRFFRVWLTSQKNLAWSLYGVFPFLSVNSLRWCIRGERAILVPRATRLNLQRTPCLKTTWPRNDRLWGRECKRLDQNRMRMRALLSCLAQNQI